MLHFRTKVLTSVPGIFYSVVKAVPGFLEVSDVWRWVINNTVALFSGLTSSTQSVAQAFNAPLDSTPRAHSICGNIDRTQ
eukprot:6427965-Amphidinium_carterae.1